MQPPHAILDVRSFHDFRDQGEAARAVGGHIPQIMFLDAPDGHEGHIHLPDHEIQNGSDRKSVV